MTSYTYKVSVNTPEWPLGKKPFRTVIRTTRGRFKYVTVPMGLFGFRYAVFGYRRGELLVPTHDLTEETKLAINLAKWTE